MRVRDYGDYVPVCTEAGVTQCAFGVVEERPCGDDEVCRDGLEAAVCVSADAEPCDPDGFDARCRDDAVAELCDPTTGWTLPFPCEDGDRCFEGAFGAVCADEAPVTCDVSAFEASCADGVASFCSDQGIVVETPCGVDEACAVDVTCWVGPPIEVALCFPTDAAPCPEPTDLFCNDGTMAVCIDGNVAIDLSFWECTDDDEVPACDG